MMKVYSLDDYDLVSVVGDIHGEFERFFHEIKQHLSKSNHFVNKRKEEFLKRKSQRIEELRNIRKETGEIDEYERTLSITEQESKISSRSKLEKLDNSIIIVAGDVGIGFNKEAYYTQLFEKFNSVLSDNNTHLFFVRGNHDDPDYYDGEKINYSNLKAIPDYSVIKTKIGNILCVGGAISSDRTWRWKQEEKKNRYSNGKSKKKLYWSGESPVMDVDSLHQIIEGGNQIEIVVSHIPPMFAEPSIEEEIYSDCWLTTDPQLCSDISSARGVMDGILNFLNENGHFVRNWYYGHYHLDMEYDKQGIRFMCLSTNMNFRKVELRDPSAVGPRYRVSK